MLKYAVGGEKNMDERAVAKRLAYLREELQAVGEGHTESQRRIEALTRSIEHLREDLLQMRAEAIESQQAAHEDEL